MPSTPTNIMQAVATFNKSELGALQNSYALLANSNKLFDDFANKIVSNLGTTVNMRLPYRFITTNGLSPTLQGVEQRLHSLVVDQAFSTNMGINDQERVFNLKTEEYMEEIGDAAVLELGAKIESVVARNADSSVPVNTGTLLDPTPTGDLHTESGPYRFFGDGVTAIDSFQKLAQAIANQKDFGAVANGGKMKIYLPTTEVPAIVGDGVSQFVLKRNEELAASWELGTAAGTGATYYTSNQLPVHYSGTIGDSASPNNLITVTGIVTDAKGGVIALQCSTPITNDSQAIKSGDLLQFEDGIAGKPNMRFLNFTGHNPCCQRVQVRATANAASVGGTVTVPIYPTLQVAPGGNQNINNAVQLGMVLKITPSHKCGLLVNGNALFCAMPKLQNTEPFPSSVETDKMSGASMRLYYGYIIEQGVMGFFRSALLATTLVPEYCQRLLFPL